MDRNSLSKNQIKILLLEGVHKSAVNTLHYSGYTNIDYRAGAISTEELKAIIGEVHFLGIRSCTVLSEEVLSLANKLVAIGCFCIGTNQVDLNAAAKQGIPVFNAPFSNTRSVAEMVLGQILLLLRKIPQKNVKAHRGEWDKSADSCFEARNKILGIVGYGHIGTQLGILAESLGMRVCFYDIEKKLSLGNAKQLNSLTELLCTSDVVSLHVPEDASTKNMISTAEFSSMKKGAVFINAARGTVVDIDALCTSLKTGHLLGAAIDVFPNEPKTNKDSFKSVLQEFDNVILTPHIGGSTQEAQQNIGIEVASKLAKYSDNGSTLSSVNFPEVALPPHNAEVSRLLHIHQNKPGVLTNINTIFANEGINIAAQYLQTNASYGYVVIDVETEKAEQLLQKLKSIDGTIRARLLH